MQSLKKIVILFETPKNKMSSIKFTSTSILSANQETTKTTAQELEAQALAQSIPHDNRSLYEKLAENKQQELDAKIKENSFANQIRRLDGDEVEFLDRLNGKLLFLRD